MHQKQPPPNVASSVVLVVFIFLSDGSPARATATLRASISQNICFMLHEFCRISTQPSYKQTLPFLSLNPKTPGPVVHFSSASVRSKCSPDGKSAYFSRCSGRNGSLIAFSWLNHLPRSMSLQRC